MSTFLQLVQDLHRECGAAGTAPAAVTGNAGQNARLVKWIAEADYSIQTLWTDWKFLWAETSGLATTATVATLAKPSDLNYWDFDTFRIDGDPIDVVEHHDVKAETPDTSSGIPSRIIILPNRNLKFEPIPDAIYSITAEYFKKPTKLSAGGDISAIPVEFELAVLGRAMMLYANYEAAPEIKTQGSELYTEHLARLENSQLPNKKNARFKQGGHFEVIAE